MHQSLSEPWSDRPSLTWVPKAALGQLEEHVVSLRTYPPIPTGTPDPYVPPN